MRIRSQVLEPDSRTEILTEANMTMTDLTVRSLDASTKKIALNALADLRSKLRGIVALPSTTATTLPALSGTQ